VCLGLLLLLLLPLQLATTGWALLGPEQAATTKLTLLRGNRPGGPSARG
jgi:hypothetical protein